MQDIYEIATGRHAMSDTILTEQHGDLTQITLNRPDRLNSFNEEMHLALRAALDATVTSG